MQTSRCMTLTHTNNSYCAHAVPVTRQHLVLVVLVCAHSGLALYAADTRNPSPQGYVASPARCVRSMRFRVGPEHNNVFVIYAVDVTLAGNS